jgi:hypothetical protein
VYVTVCFCLVANWRCLLILLVAYRRALRTVARFIAMSMIVKSIGGNRWGLGSGWVGLG